MKNKEIKLDIFDLFNNVAYKNGCVLNSRKMKLTDEEIEAKHQEFKNRLKEE